MIMVVMNAIFAIAYRSLKNSGFYQQYYRPEIYGLLYEIAKIAFITAWIIAHLISYLQFNI